MAKILLVDDDADLAAVVRDWLEDEHHTVDVLFDGADAETQLRIYEYDVIVLDWMLPRQTGVAVCKRYKDRGGKAPVLLLTGKKSVSDREEGLDSGADDYLVKPFHPRELSARLRSLLRRPPAQDGAIQFEDLIIDVEKLTVTKSGKAVNLSPREFKLLEFFIRHPGVVIGNDLLLERVWDDESSATANTVRVHVNRLRNKITAPDDQQGLLKTVHGQGYILKA